MSNSGLQMLVDNWITDVQRRGAELYAMNQANQILYLSFQGEGRFRYSIQIDFDVQEILFQIDCPDWDSFNCETFLLNAESLRSLAKRICPVPEQQAIVPVYLLVRLSILCHAYQRLVQDYDQEKRIRTSTNTVLQIESELRRYLTPEEQQRTDNPYLQTSRRSANS
ncbi:MAG TPA: hypothetical protein VE242_07875 [Chthoniobacterales bacterium]|nr:hypothetical protein [Chthoniobacterales bacterium]